MVTGTLFPSWLLRSTVLHNRSRQPCATFRTALHKVGNQVGLSTNQIINAMQSGNQAILTQLADCCCKTQNAITTMGYENQLAMCNQTNQLVNTANQNTLSLRDGATANTNAILAKLDAIQNQVLQDKIAALTAEKATLTAEISQRNQNATILNAVGRDRSVGSRFAGFAGGCGRNQVPYAANRTRTIS